MHAGVPREFGAGQVQRKQSLIGAGGAGRAMTRPQRRHQHRSVGRHQAKPAPAWHEPGAIGLGHEPLIEPLQRRHVQPCARLGEGAVADGSHQARPAQQRAEEAIEHGLLRARAHRQQRGHQRGQGQLATARECAGMIGVPSALRELRRGELIGQVQQQRLDVCTVFRSAFRTTLSSGKTSIESTA